MTMTIYINLTITPSMKNEWALALPENSHRRGRLRARGANGVPSAAALGLRVYLHASVGASEGKPKQKVGVRLCPPCAPTQHFVAMLATLSPMSRQ